MQTFAPTGCTASLTRTESVASRQEAPASADPCRPLGPFGWTPGRQAAPGYLSTEDFNHPGDWAANLVKLELHGAGVTKLELRNQETP